MKLIIENKSSVSAEDALTLVRKVVQMGRISDDSYCYATTFFMRNAVVHASKNKCSDKFLILNKER